MEFEMENNIPSRGSLKYKVNNSTQWIEAGKEYSISVSIVNTFDVPVTIKSVSTKLPVEFVNVANERF